MNNLVSDIKDLRHKLTVPNVLRQVIQETSLKDKVATIYDTCSLALKYAVYGYIRKAARCYLYALAAWKLVKRKICTTLIIISKDSKEQIGSLIYNPKSKLYEGEVDFKEWNFYFKDEISETVYGCDDNCTSQQKDVNRSYKLVERTIGDKFHNWFDPTMRPVKMKVNLNTMTWGYEI